jgi:hypothetical protein
VGKSLVLVLRFCGGVPWRWQAATQPFSYYPVMILHAAAGLANDEIARRLDTRRK